MRVTKWNGNRLRRRQRQNSVLLLGKSGRHADGFWGAIYIAGNGCWVWPYVRSDPTHWCPCGCAAWNIEENEMGNRRAFDWHEWERGVARTKDAGRRVEVEREDGATIRGSDWATMGSVVSTSVRCH